jgi:hypothetical protein
MQIYSCKRLIILKAFFLISSVMGTSIQAQSCSPACSSEEICCGTTCYSKSVYSMCCGDNNACAPKEYCCVEGSTNKGTCYPINDAPSSCCSGVDCPSNQVCMTKSCPPESSCSVATCVPSGPPSGSSSPVKVQYFKSKNLTP